MNSSEIVERLKSGAVALNSDRPYASVTMSEAASHIEAQEKLIAEMRMELVSTAEFLTDLLRHCDDMAADARLYSIDRVLSVNLSQKDTP